MRKSSKEHREQLARREKALQAEVATAVKAPPAKTFSATHPAYTYTSLCPDPRLRKVPRPRPEHLGGIKAQVTKRKVTQAHARDGTQV